VPKVVLTARGPDIWSLILSRFSVDVVPKPAHLGDLLGALELAYFLALEINEPERVRERTDRVLAAIRSAARPRVARHLHRRIGRTLASMARSL
jgi:hypothetical protein